MGTKALLITNVGTPDFPEKKFVGKYLTEFLNDPRVIDIPWLLRKILVNGIIVPFRVSNSTRLYKRVWTPEGSPLLVYLNSLASKIQELSNGKFTVYKAMRYGNPSLTNTLQEITNNNHTEIIVFPLFPQYASSTSGTILAKIMEYFRCKQVIPGIRFIPQFYKHPAFINAFKMKIETYGPSSFDHILFSYHGLPVRHIKKIHPENDCSTCACINEMPDYGNFCYKATCYATSKLLAENLGLQQNQYTTTFQSRLTKNWLTPFTDQVITELAQNGAKKILVAAPSFVADCLETIDEIGVEYKELFIRNGGKELALVHSLNDSDIWARAILEIIND